jgi:hypothetical protein
VAENDSAALSSVSFPGISIGALVELCCASHVWHQTNNHLGTDVFERVADALPVVKASYRLLVRALRDPESSRFAANDAAFSVTAIAQKRAFLDRSWSDYQQAFAAAVKSAGFQPGFALALSAAFGEIVENVPDHSADSRTEMAAALVAYYVCPGELHFAVGDLGRGVLASLHENPQWAKLRQSRDAILATLQQGATRKVEHSHGAGFTVALKSFVDRSGMLSVSTGDATAHVGRDSEGRRVISRFAPWLQGTCVAGSCLLRQNPQEKAISPFCS